MGPQYPLVSKETFWEFDGADQHAVFFPGGYSMKNFFIAVRVVFYQITINILMEPPCRVGDEKSYPHKVFNRAPVRVLN